MNWRPRPSPASSRRFDLTQLLPPFAPTQPAHAWLFGLARMGMKPGLERISALLARLGNPERRLTSVVVAGTNGKGSAATYLARLSATAGLRTGLYTSPHLLRPGERIAVDGIALDDAALTRLIERCRTDAEAVEATFFETMTAMAALHFAEQEVELAVMETGLGGRLDATNALGAVAVLLTSIGDDHHQILGDSLAEIAAEKLGLARKGIWFYAGSLPEGIGEQARATVARVGAHWRDLSHVDSELLEAEGGGCRVRFRDGERELVARLPQRGTMQAQTAALAWACWSDLATSIGLPAVDAAAALETSRVACRYERYGWHPELLLDTAHNSPALERVLAQWTSETAFPDRVLIFGVMRDKRLRAVLPQLPRTAPTLLLAAPRWERSLSPTDLAAQVTAAAVAIPQPGFQVLPCDTVKQALEEARGQALRRAELGGSPSVLVTGSNFLVAEVLDRLGVDDVASPPHSPLWDTGVPLRDRPEREVAAPWSG